VRAFEQTPPDIILLCGEVGPARLVAVLEAIRARPLGGLVPCVTVCDEPIEGADAHLGPDVEMAELIAELSELLGFDAAEITASPLNQRGSAVASAPVSEAVIEKKLRQVRHETYFDVLEVGSGVDEQRLRDAFASLWDRFARGAVPVDIARRFEAELDEVRDGLEDAYAVLSNQRLRAAYSDSRES